MWTVIQDLRYGARMSLRSPGFTLVAVFTLAIGIAANTTVFSWLDMMLLRPVPGASKGSQLVSFESVAADGGPLATSYADYRDYRDQLTLVSGLTAIVPATLSIGVDDQADRAWGELVSGNYFDVLGVRPALGRLFSKEEHGDQSGAHPVVVLGHGLWVRRFNGDPHVIGTTLIVNRQPLTIVGVAPPEFHGSMPGVFFELWVPLTMGPQIRMMPEAALHDRSVRMVVSVARLRQDVTVEQARAEGSLIARRLAESEPRTNGGIGATFLPIRQSHFGGQAMMDGPLRILMAACGVVFLIVCANVANLLLARATTRRREFSLRLAMGAGRARLARHLLAESLVLASLGMLFGVPLAMWMSQSLGYLMPRGARVPINLEIPLNADILLFNLVICLVACVVSGIAPALHSARADLNEVLKEGGRSGSEGARSQRLRGALVAAEVAMALVAVIGAGLFARSFQMATRIDPGMDPRNVLVAHIDLSAADYGTIEKRLFCERLGSRIASQPGIVRVSWADVVPLYFTGNPVEGVEVEGYVPALNESMKIARNVVAPGYFDLLRIPLLEGRDFNGQDKEDSQRVMIINQTFASRFFPGRQALGRRVRAMGEWYTVVGVARDGKYIKPTENAQPYFYVPVRQAFDVQMVIAHLRTAGEPEAAAAMLRREVNAMDPAVTVFDALPMTESISAGLFGQRMAAVMLAGLGVFALALATTGLYSVMSYSVAQRTQEIGVRMALGAQPSDVFGLVLRQGMVLTFVGVAIGLAAAMVLARLVSSQLVRVSATDPLVFIAAPAFLTAVAVAANYLPVRRATRIDPKEALRSL